MDVCPLADLMLPSNETASLGISSLRTEPPMGLLTHLQSHSGDVMDAGAGRSESAICEYKILDYITFILLGSGLSFSLGCVVITRCG